jgi:hypothetical protein
MPRHEKNRGIINVNVSCGHRLFFEFLFSRFLSLFVKKNLKLLYLQKKSYGSCCMSISCSSLLYISNLLIK